LESRLPSVKNHHIGVNFFDKTSAMRFRLITNAQYHDPWKSTSLPVEQIRLDR
jgi:hypothetical protein